LTNEVGKNLRRSTGSTWTAVDTNADQIFIQQAINEAKRMVEDNWESDALTVSMTFSSVASQHSYELATAGTPNATDRAAPVRSKRDYRLQLYDVTDNEYQFNECSREYAQKIETLDTNTVAKPTQAAVYPSKTGLVVHFPWAPTGVRNYKIYVKNPQDDFGSSDASTELTVPWRPVVLAATALAAEERGEELGLDATRWWDQYQDALGSMVARESFEHDLTLVAETTDYINPF
tara:strand:+ start:6784 stop:7485 length:702 start_codon:yes stop_codon:yes gene_type:complete